MDCQFPDLFQIPQIEYMYLKDNDHIRMPD